MATRVRSILTFKDLVDHLAYFLEGNPSQECYRACRRAVLSAVDELAGMHTWSYFTRQGRLNLSAPYSTGTIEYDHTGGSVSGTNYERLVTLTDGDFPEWAAYGVLVISDVTYNVATRIDDDNLQLEIGSNPGEDVDSGTSYTLYRDTYTLPSDLVSIDRMFPENSWDDLSFIHPREWLGGHRHNVTSAQPPDFFTVMGARDFMGVLCARFFPYPDSATTMDFIYRARPRALQIENHESGTVTVTADSAALTGSDTEWTSDMVGSVVRISDDRENYPTGRDGANPFDQERIIISVADATNATVDRNWDTTRSSGVLHRVSDPVDIEIGGMTTALLRVCEQQVAAIRQLERYKEIAALAADAVERAMEADSRTTGPRSVDTEGVSYRRLANMPLGSDVE